LSYYEFDYEVDEQVCNVIWFPEDWYKELGC